MLLRYESVVFKRDELCTNQKTTSYLLFYIWSVYEIMIHIKYVCCHKFETKLLLIANTIYENCEESKLIHMAVNGGGL